MKHPAFLRPLLTLLLIGLAVHILLPQVANFEHAIQVVRSMVLWAVGLAIVAQCLSYLGSGYLLRGIALLGGQELSPWRGMMITASSYSIGLIGGGLLGSTAATYRWMRAGNVNPEAAILGGWLPGILDDMLLILIALIGLIYLLTAHQLTSSQAAGFLVILLLLSLVAAGLAWAARHRSQVTSLMVTLARRWAVIRRRPFHHQHVEEAAHRLFLAVDQFIGGVWRNTLTGAGLSMLFDMASLLFIFLAAGHPVSPGVLLLGYGLPLLLGKAPLLPGGVGLVEASMTALYTSLGIPGEISVVVVLSYRFLSFWIPVLVGFTLIPFLRTNSE